MAYAQLAAPGGTVSSSFNLVEASASGNSQRQLAQSANELQLQLQQKTTNKHKQTRFN